MPRRLLLALAAGAALPLTGCGVVGLAGDSMPAAEVATTAEDALELEVGARPDITCPDRLEKEEGATTRCTLTAEGDSTEVGVTVTVLETDGDLQFDVEVDDEPLD